MQGKTLSQRNKMVLKQAEGIRIGDLVMVAGMSVPVKGVVVDLMYSPPGDYLMAKIKSDAWGIPPLD